MAEKEEFVRKFKPGDIAQLQTGGPKVTVRGTYVPDDSRQLLPTVYCTYFCNATNRFIECDFSEGSLKLVEGMALKDSANQA